MFVIVVEGTDGSSRRFVFTPPEVMIGRARGNHLVLPDSNVSRRHARLVLKDDKLIIVDLASVNGTFVNFRRITSPIVLHEGDRVRISDFTLAIERTADDELTPMPPYVASDPVEDGLLRAITERDDANREVYADWLEERGDLGRAEFLRVQQALVALDPDDPQFAGRSARLRELGLTLDVRWRIRVARPAIERCPSSPKFDFKCPKDWGALAPTDRDDVRFCGSCKQQVHYCTNVADARAHAARGACVALDVKAIRWRRDLAPPYGEQRCQECHADVGYGADRCPRCGEVVRVEATVGMMA